jgi:hypothetical protein
MANPRLIPYAPIWIKEFATDELLKYDGFETVIAVPASAMSIQDVLKNYKTYSFLLCIRLVTSASSEGAR